MVFSKMIRKAIWKWVEEYPYQFADVCASKVQSGFETLFDMCSATIDNPEKRAILWPLQIILLVLSPRRLSQLSLDDQEDTSNLLFQLKHSLQNPKERNITVSCYVDLYKAATYVEPTHEGPIVRSLASIIEKEIKAVLWNINTPPHFERDVAFPSYSIVDEQTLLTDFLVSSFRLQPKKALNDLVFPSIEEGVHLIYKLVLVKSCLVLAEEEKKLSWNHSLSEIYDGICSPLRHLFLQTVRLDFASLANKKKEARSSQRIELLIDLLRLFTADTKLVILGDDLDRIEQNSAVMVGLMDLSQHPVQQIRQYALGLIIKMHQVDTIVEWGPADGVVVQNFWKISSPAMLCLAQKLLDSSANEESLKTMFQLLNKLLKLRNRFVKMKQVYINCFFF